MNSNSIEVRSHLEFKGKTLGIDNIEAPYQLTYLPRPYPLSLCENIREDFDISELNLDIKTDYELIFAKKLPEAGNFYKKYNCKDPQF